MSKVVPSVATSSESLAVRLAINERYSSADFQTWLQTHLAVGPGMDVLDVGCGTGAQSLRFLELVGLTGSVSALDVSEKSVAHLRELAKGRPNLQAEAADMAELSGVIANRFRVRRYDLAQSTYALYYAADPAAVLDAMRQALKPGGRLAVCVPNNPHGLVELVKRFRVLPEAVEAGGRFGQEVLEPYFRRHCQAVDIHLLRNDLAMPSADEVIRFFANTSYYDPAIEGKLREAVDAEIARTDKFTYQKNSYLIIGAPIPAAD